MHKIHGLMKFMFMSDQMGFGHTYTLCASVLVPRDIPVAELQHAANELLRINDELRVRFVEDGKTKEVYQEIKPYEERNFDVLHFGSKEELDAWGNEYAGIPLPLDVRKLGRRGISPLYWLIEVQKLVKLKVGPKDIAGFAQSAVHRARLRKKLGIKAEPCCCEMRLVKLPDASGAIVKVHHIVSDAWSISLMANQFLQVLKGETPVAYSYEEHLESDEAYRKSKAFQRDLAYFEDQLKRGTAQNLPSEQAARRKTITLDEELSASIMSYASDHNMTPYALFFAAMSAYLRCEKGLDEFFISSMCINRTGSRERNMVGLFYSMPPVLLELDPDASFANTIETVSAANFKTMRHQKACYDVSNPRPNLYDVSYQNATIDADPTAVCTQYYCNYFNGCMLTAEDRAMEGRYKLHLDVNLSRWPDDSELDKLLDYVVAALRDGIADDTKLISQLGA